MNDKYKNIKDEITDSKSDKKGPVTSAIGIKHTIYLCIRFKLM